MGLYIMQAKRPSLCPCNSRYKACSWLLLESWLNHKTGTLYTARIKCTPLKSKRCYCSFRSEEHTSELQSRENLVCRLLLEKKKQSVMKTDKASHSIDPPAN